MPEKIDYDALAREHGGVRVAGGDQPPQVNLTQAPLDVLKGVGMGALSTGAHIADTIQRMSGTPRVLEDPEVQSLITPRNPYENIGYGVEKAGEFFLPSGLVGKGTQAVEAATLGRRGATLMNLAARSGLEGMASGGIAGLQTGFDPEAMKDAALTGAGVTATLGAAGEAVPAVGRLLERRAVNQYGKVLHPTMRTTKYTSRTETIPGMLERKVRANSMEGLLEHTQDQAEHWGKEVQNAWATIPQDTPIALAPMLQHLDDSVAQATASGVQLGPAAKVMIDHADEMKGVLANLAKPNPQTGVPEIAVGDLRKLKWFSEKIAARKGAYEGKTIAESSLDSTYETVADAARNQINPRFPQVEQANQQYHFWKGAEKVADETVQRRVGQERGLLRYIGNTIAAGLGGTIGHALGDGPMSAAVGTLIGTKAGDMLQQALTSTYFRTLSAVTKQRLADAFINGNKGAIEFYLRQILKGAGGAMITIPTSKELPEPKQMGNAIPQAAP